MKKCIDNLTHFLEHLDKLVIFFSSLYHFVDVIHEGPAQEFLAQMNNMVHVDGALARGDREPYLGLLLHLAALLSVPFDMVVL